jgi:hypothetical protein
MHTHILTQRAHTHHKKHFLPHFIGRRKSVHTSESRICYYRSFGGSKFTLSSDTARAIVKELVVAAMHPFCRL